MPRKRYLAVAGMIPILLVTLFFDPRTADTGVADFVAPEPTSTIELPAPLTATVSIPSPVPLIRAATRTIAPSDSAINGIPLDRINVLPQTVREHIRAISAQGLASGRSGRAFSKVGDSTMVYPPFLATFDAKYKLGAFSSYQVTIDNYSGSFARGSLAARKGMHTWTEFDPTWADPKSCQNGEGPLACEVRIHNPSVVVIRLGANDVSAPRYFDQQLRRIVEFCLARGIIPVVGTKPDRLEGPENTLNKIVKEIAQTFRIPLWDYDFVAGSIPGKGLEKDGVHFRGGGSRDYTSSNAFTSADSLEDLSALAMLDAIYREITGIKGH